MNKEAVAAIWANEILNNRKDFRDVPVKLQQEVHAILERLGFTFQKAGDK